ncbi:hypothetical protein BDW66DRAFT_154892 [Aspergillus desertorum]
MEANGDWDDECKLPNIKQLSNAMWIEWAARASDPGSIKYIFQMNVVNLDTRAIIEEAITIDSAEDAEADTVFYWEFSMTSETGQALLGTPNGNPQAWFLINHKTALGADRTADPVTGLKTISKVRIWANKEQCYIPELDVEDSDGDVEMDDAEAGMAPCYHMLFYITDAWFPNADAVEEVQAEFVVDGVHSDGGSEATAPPLAGLFPLYLPISTYTLREANLPPTQTMDQFPPEIKHIIAKCTRDQSMESLNALSLVDQEWPRVARPLLYEHIIVRILDGEVPRKLLWLPDAERVLAHVKRVSIVAKWSTVNGLTPTRVPNAYSHLRATLEEGNMGDQSIPKLGICAKGRWPAVIDLLRRLPPLQDIDLLICRGVLPSFTRPFRSITPPVGDWVSLPQLHAAHVTCFEYPGRRNFSEHPDRVLESIIVRAPHVKKLALQIAAGGTVGPAPDYNMTVEVDRTAEMTAVCARLELLSWPLNTRMPAQQFLKWGRLIDYSCLGSWTVGCVEDAQLLWAIAELRPFQQLTRLTLALYPPRGDELAFDSAAEAMFDSLSPLRYLCLLGAYQPTLLTNAVLRKHGPALLELKLDAGPNDRNHQALRRLRERGPTGPIFPAEEIHLLAAQCSSLEKLRICIQRNRGFETDVYTALAHLPRLKELELFVNCPPRVGPDETPIPPRELFDFENARAPANCFGLPVWYIRDTMIDSAIDDDLAKGIGTLIRTHQTGSSRLQKLTLRPVFRHDGPAATHSLGVFSADILKVLASVWTVEMDLVAGVRAVKNAQGNGDECGLFAGQLQLETIFNSIWPAQKGDDSVQLWRWHSWPLQLV